MSYILKNRRTLILPFFVLLISLLSGSAVAMKRSLIQANLTQDLEENAYLPLDMWHVIFSYFDLTTLRAAIYVSQQWYVGSKYYFKKPGHLIIEHYPEEDKTLCYINFGDNNKDLKRVPTNSLTQFIAYADTLTLIDLSGPSISALLSSLNSQKKIKNLCIKSQGAFGLSDNEDELIIDSQVIRQNLVDLKKFDILYPFGIKSEALELSTLNLESFALHDAHFITDKNISNITGITGELLLGGAAITEVGLSIIATNNPHIKTLKLDSARGIKPDALSKISLPHLELLSLKNIDLRGLNSDVFLQNQFKKSLIFQYGPPALEQEVIDELTHKGIKCEMVTVVRKLLFND